MELKRCRTALVAKAEEEERDSQQSGSGLSSAPAEILVEILKRLPNCKEALQFKLVSKRWNSILSDPYFLRCAAAFHLHDYGGGGLFSLIFQLATNSEKHKTPVLALEVPKHQQNGRRVRHLHLDRLIGGHGLKIAASCNDLLLVEQQLNRYQYACEYYYVVNVQTHEWIALPPAPSSVPDYALGAHAYFKHGLLCHYDYHYSTSTFKVIRIPYVLTTAVDIAQTSSLDRTEFSVHIYSSDSKQWCQYTADWYPFVLTHFLTTTPIVSHNGMFHWVNGRALLSLNPSDLVVIDNHGDTGVGAPAPLRLRLNRTLELPEKNFLVGSEICFFSGKVSMFLGIGVVQDQLRIVTKQIDRGAGHPHLLVWKLDESKIGAANADVPWSLTHNILISGFLSFDFLACHPYEGDVLLVQILNFIYQINLHTQKLCKATGKPYYQGNCFLSNVVPPLLHQWLPTPLTSLSPNSPL